MIEAALLVMAQKPFLEQQIGALFCSQPQRLVREHCLRVWRRSDGCGCG